MDASIRRKSLGLTILFHGLVLLALFFFAITTRIPPFDESLAGGGGGGTIVDFGEFDMAAEGAAAPQQAQPVAEQASADEELITTEIEETAPAPESKKSNAKKPKETTVKNKKPVKEVAVVKPQIKVPQVRAENLFKPKNSQGTSSTANAGDQGAKDGQKDGSMFPGMGGSGTGTGTGDGSGSGPGKGAGNGPFAGLYWGAGGGRAITYAPQFRSKTNEPGKVRLKVFVDENGNVTRVDRDNIQTLNPEQVEEAIAYVKKVKFSRGSGISIAYPTIEFSAR